MNLTVYYGIRKDTEHIGNVQTVLYPETTLYPQDFFDTLEQISKNLISNNVNEMKIITTSPIILNATELLAAKLSYTLVWIDCSEGGRVCCEHEELYRKIAMVLQEYENMRWSDDEPARSTYMLDYEKTVEYAKAAIANDSRERLITVDTYGRHEIHDNPRSIWDEQRVVAKVRVVSGEIIIETVNAEYPPYDPELAKSICKEMGITCVKDASCVMINGKPIPKDFDLGKIFDLNGYKKQ